MKTIIRFYLFDNWESQEMERKCEGPFDIIWEYNFIPNIGDNIYFFDLETNPPIPELLNKNNGDYFFEVTKREWQIKDNGDLRIVLDIKNHAHEWDK